MAARWVSVTSAQSMMLGKSRRTILSRTASVRPQMPAVGSNAATVTVAVSVSGAVPREVLVARPVTVRVKVSSVPAVSAGIVTTGVGARGGVERHGNPARRSGQRPGIGNIRAPRPAIAAAAVERHRAPTGGNRSVIGQGIRGGREGRPQIGLQLQRRQRSQLVEHPGGKRGQRVLVSASASSARSARRTPRREAWTESCCASASSSARTPRREACPVVEQRASARSARRTSPAGSVSRELR